MAKILQNCPFPHIIWQKLCSRRAYFTFKVILKWSKMVIFNTSIHIFEIGSHLECDMSTKMAEILQNWPFPHIIWQKCCSRGAFKLFYFQSDLKWSKIVIFNISIHIFEIGSHLECDILTKMADILQNCPFPHII